MTAKECEQLTEGLFEAMKWQLKNAVNLTKIQMLRYSTGDITDLRLLHDTLRDRVVEVGRLRTFMTTAYRFAHLEASESEEYKDFLAAWEEADRYIFGSYTETRDTFNTVYKSREQGSDS